MFLYWPVYFLVCSSSCRYLCAVPQRRRINRTNGTKRNARGERAGPDIRIFIFPLPTDPFRAKLTLISCIFSCSYILRLPDFSFWKFFFSPLHLAGPSHNTFLSEVFYSRNIRMLPFSFLSLGLLQASFLHNVLARCRDNVRDRTGQEIGIRCLKPRVASYHL